VKTNEPLWIEERDVLSIHDRLLALNGGAKGLRDRALLQSALGRSRHHHTYSETPDILHMAALYTAGIIRNHPFVDGNKRTGFVTGVLFLELNGFNFEASEEDATEAVFGLAERSLDEAAYAVWLGQNSKRKRKR
jgi:death-on-curing protein